jgi:uncharacterized DUF497 family protein
MEIVFECDAGKRTSLSQARGFDLLDMAEVFADPDRLDFPAKSVVSASVWHWAGYSR